MLTVDGVTVRRATRTIVKSVSMTVAAGEIVGVVGKNGCGKSTLLQAIAGVLEPHEGRVVIDKASVWGPRGERRRARAALGYVPENADPPGFMLPDELWALCAATRGALPPSQALRERLGLDELRATPIERMSLGMRRRTCLGAAFIGPPKLLVLDEPDNGLDALRLEALIILVKEHAANGGACVLASHDAALLETLGARTVSVQAAAAASAV